MPARRKRSERGNDRSHDIDPTIQQFPEVPCQAPASWLSTGPAVRRYARWIADDLTRTVTEVVLADAPPGAVIVGLSIAPDEKRAAALTLLPSANYLMENLYELVDGAWESGEGGSGGPGVNWSGGDVGVLRFSGEASGDSQTAIILYRGKEHRVPINHGYFLFVVWDTAFSQNPAVVRFE